MEFGTSGFDSGWHSMSSFSGKNSQCSNKNRRRSGDLMQKLTDDDG